VLARCVFGIDGCLCGHGWSGCEGSNFQIYHSGLRVPEMRNAA
jgi:hypothetical protein